MCIRDRTLEKDVGFGLKYSRLSREEKQERVRWALEQMGFSYEEIKDQSPLSLSGGEKRRVCLLYTSAAFGFTTLSPGMSFNA